MDTQVDTEGRFSMCNNNIDLVTISKYLPIHRNKMSSFLLTRSSSMQVLRCSGNKIVLDKPISQRFNYDFIIYFESKQLGENKVIGVSDSTLVLFEKEPIDET